MGAVKLFMHMQSFTPQTVREAGAPNISTRTHVEAVSCYLFSMRAPETTTEIVLSEQHQKNTPKHPILQDSQNPSCGLLEYPGDFLGPDARLCNPYFDAFRRVKKWGSIMHPETATNGVQLCTCRCIYLRELIGCPPFARLRDNRLTTRELIGCPPHLRTTK